MIAHIRQNQRQINTSAAQEVSPPPITVSVELEKRKPELAQLLPLADLLLVSKEYAGYHGYSSPEEACQEFKKRAQEG